IDNRLSHAPGFRIDNVFVLAGIPSVARAMFEAVVPQLSRGAAIQSRAIDVFLREGDIAGPLERIADANPEVEIGSYPFSRDGRFGATLVVRGTDGETVRRVTEEISAAMVALGGEPTPGE